MLGSKARWDIGEAEACTVEQFVEAFRIDPLIAKLLVLRDIRTVEQAELFLHGGRDQFHDPFLLDGMKEAVERIRLALDKGEKIRIYGDYDADGISSTSLMVHLLRHLHAHFDTYIPHRVREGYGLNRKAIELAKEQGVSLLITVDTGISAVEEVAYIQQLGMDVIVTDHHEPPEALPQALAVINPKKTGCLYPFKQLAGVGVAFKLAHALLGRLPEELFEMAAIGTVADLMPLVDENRLLVKFGLERMQASSYVGIKALLGVAGLERKEVTSGHIGFALAPRINASGRLECADDAVRLLTTGSEQEAEQIARELDALNMERQRIVEEMTKEAMMLAEQQKEQGLDKVIVIAREEWNVGVIGIVASKLVERFYRPAIVLSIDPGTGMAKGSARSIAGFDMYQALARCKEWLDHFGGHQAAAGMSLHRSDLDAFARRLNELAASWLTEEDLIPLMRADAECRFSEVPVSLIEQLEQLAPFGMGNPTPKIVFTGLQIEDIRTMGKEKQHLKLALTQAQDEVSVSLEAVGFGKGALAELIAPTAKVDAVGELSINEWNGNRKPQLTLQDLRISHLQLFDWRGISKPDNKLASLEAALAANLRGVSAQAPGIVLFSEADLKASSLHKASPGGYSLWVLDRSGTLRASNSFAESTSFSQLSDVVLYSLPQKLQHLQSVLEQAVSMGRCYALFTDLGPDQGNGMPSRDSFKMVYGVVKQQGGWDLANKSGVSGFSRRSGLSTAMIEFMLRVFEELGFIERIGTVYKQNPSPAKRELSSSRLYQERLSRMDVEQICIYSSARELEQWIIPHTKSTLKLEEIV